MAIDGVIAFVTTGSEYGEQALDLFIVDRLSDVDEGGNRGQPDLRILRPSWLPEVGTPIWGGADTVRIGERAYDRVGYTRLVERD